MLYTMADMNSLKIVDYQSTTRKTLYNLLNKTVTQHGALQLLRWLRAPTTDLAVISYRHDIVQYLSGEHLSGPLHASVRRTLRSCPHFQEPPSFYVLMQEHISLLPFSRNFLMSTYSCVTLTGSSSISSATPAMLTPTQQRRLWLH